MDSTNHTFDRAAPAEAAFEGYVNPIVAEAIEHASALEDGADAETLHKLRIALRRLRTLLWAYRPILNGEFDNEQRALFKSLANAAGNTRYWDILISLVEKNGEAALLEALKRNRNETAKKSVETLRNNELGNFLQESVNEVHRELTNAPDCTPLKKFARKRVKAAQEQLKRRMRHARKVGSSDYDSYHDVRKAGKKVRYLIEFFEPLLGKTQRKSMKSLKRLQKLFGALNDVVASHELLSAHRASLPRGANAKDALRSLKKEQKRRINAVAKFL
ncbi:CHAD domain protein [Caballeronia sp. SBC1]|uniref:CHAD domain-containing protein n=1 Tax=Caballeronia sp. SBC1 TaxID=2705548 RepID=UPI001408926C|nr:CHAD domain-containing protein [Caballeronia sp. SBC1]QIN62611.1 CHAD domain protein [Caballeronia sp. SBC1]